MPASVAMPADGTADRAGIDDLACRLSVGLLALAPWTVFLATRPFWIGVWVQAEAVQIGQFLVGAAGALLLAIRRQGREAALHPLPLTAFALAVWSILASALASAPILSWTGPPQSGEGALAYLVFGILSALAIDLRRRGRSLLAVAASCALAATACGVATLLGDGGAVWEPYWFPDYLAFPGLWAGAALVVALLPTARRAGLSIGLSIGIGLSVFLLIASENRAAIALCLTLAGLAAATLRPDGSSRMIAAPRTILLIPATVLATTAALWTFGRFDLLPVSMPVQETLESRARLIELGLVSLADSPGALLFGFGWGSMEDLLARHLLLGDVTLQPFADTALTSNWDAIDNNHFHTHNGFLEALVAAGLPGLAGFSALFLVPAVVAPPRRRGATVFFLAVAAGLHACWFQMPATLPMMAIAFALLVAPDATLPGRRIALGCTVARAALPAAALLLAGVGLLQWHRALDADRVQAAIEGDPHAVAEVLARDCADLLPAYGRGDVDLAYLYHRLATGETSGSDANPALVDALDCAASRWMQPGGAIRLGLAAISMRNAVAFEDRIAADSEVGRRLLTDWEPQLRRLLRRLPGRSDLAVPYLQWRLLAGDDPAIRRLAETILQHDPRDPVGLWFSGIVLLNDPARQVEGLARMRAAVDGGLVRVMPVPPELVQMLEDN